MHHQQITKCQPRSLMIKILDLVNNILSRKFIFKIFGLTSISSDGHDKMSYIILQTPIDITDSLCYFKIYFSKEVRVNVTSNVDGTL